MGKDLPPLAVTEVKRNQGKRSSNYILKRRGGMGGEHIKLSRKLVWIEKMSSIYMKLNGKYLYRQGMDAKCWGKQF